MRSRLLLSALVAVLATFALSLGTSAGAQAPTRDGPSAGARIFPTVDSPRTMRPAAPAAGSSANLTYMGGSVLVTPRVFLIFWGSTWSSGFTSHGVSNTTARNYIESYFRGVGGNHWLNSTTQYCQGIATGSQFCPAGATHPSNSAGQFAGSIVDTTAIPRHPTDAQVQATVRRNLPRLGTDPNALYMVLTSSGHSISGFGTQFCAYHDNLVVGGQAIAYANQPVSLDAGRSCGQNFVNGSSNSFGNGPLDGYSITAGHEYAEAISDAYPSQTIGWLDAQGAENGGKCAWSMGPGPNSAAQDITLGANQFAVQSLWSNLANGSTGGCVG